MGTNTANRALIQPTVGGDRNSWGNESNSTVGFLDTILGGWLAVVMPGNTNVQLTAAQSQNLGFKPSGALTGNSILLVPQPGLYGVFNQCTGAFSLTAAVTAGGTGVVCAQNAITFLLSDGTSIYGGGIADPDVSGPIWCGTSTGSANQQLLTPVGTSISALTAGQIFVATAGLSNTTAMQIGVSGAGGFQPAVKRTSTGTSPMGGGEVVLGNAYQWLWDGAQFQLMD